MSNLVNMDVMMKRENGYTNNWYKNKDPTVQFRPNHLHNMERVMKISSSSPPQWGSHNYSPSPSPPKSPSHPLLGLPSSSDSRARSRAIIARGQWELMEMVKNMPESSYELSLKDLVENQHTIDEIESPIRAAVVRSSKRPAVKADFERRGLFLNMVSPFSFNSGQNKKKVKAGRNFSNSKVSPKVIIDSGEKDWWKKKRFTGSSDSNSSGGTTVSSGGGSATSGGDRKKKGSPAGCWSFFSSGERKSEE